ncbi:MAG: shikimate dehydrogenase [Rubrivivax sp.]|nr:shikimate dehydrogenase [Rubrivivax sp.]
MPPTPLIRGTTEVLFCVADPVAQVKAPEAYNLVFAAAGVDTVVVPARATAGHLAAFVREALALGNARGLLVSIPHKTALMRLLDRFDAGAQAAGAVNAVRRAADGTLEGALFDGAGFVGALRHHGVATAGRRALLVGAGGAGLAIASALAATGLAELAVFDIDPARAAKLVQRVAARSPFPLRGVHAPAPAGFDLVIQATPLGLREGDPLPLDPAQVSPSATVMDILMTPRPSPLVRACRERGVAAHMGDEMLVQQMPATLEYFGYPALAEALRQPGSPWLHAVRQQAFPATPSNT